MKYIQTRLFLVALALFAMTNACFAENMEFVDANGSTGYYADTDSVSYESTKEGETDVTYVYARVAVVPARPEARAIGLWPRRTGLAAGGDAARSSPPRAARSGEGA